MPKRIASIKAIDTRTAPPGGQGGLAPVVASGDARTVAERALRRVEDARQRGLIERQAELIRAVVDFQSHEGLGPGLAALSDGLRLRLGAARVVIAIESDGDRDPDIAAISQQAHIEKRAPDTCLLASAAREAITQEQQLSLFSTGTVSGGDGHDMASLRQHRALVAGRPGIDVVTTPMYCRGDAIGAIVIESDGGVSWTAARRRLIEQIGVALAPMIADREIAARSPARRVIDSIRQRVGRVIAPTRLGAKLALVTVSLIISLSLLVPVSDRISAQAELMPLEVRLVSAPVSGYISHVAVAAGDTVRKSQLLFELDSRELLLERDRRQGEITRIGAELRAARATGDRRESAILRARRDQARAQLSLAEQRIERLRVVAPHDGVIISGDLSSLIGAPVERGQRLVELAPGGRYSVSLLVDERDIQRVQRDQRGALTLQSRPGERIDLSISDVHPVAVPGRGINRYRVDAELSNPPLDLLPGQTGIARLDAGRITLWTRTTRRFVDWVRLRHWEWFG